MTFQRYSDPFDDEARNFVVGDLIGKPWFGHSVKVITASKAASGKTWLLEWRDSDTGRIDSWTGPSYVTDRHRKDISNYVIEEDPV